MVNYESKSSAIIDKCHVNSIIYYRVIVMTMLILALAYLTLTTFSTMKLFPKDFFLKNVFLLLLAY